MPLFDHCPFFFLPSVVPPPRIVLSFLVVFFFFQAEDGIRDGHVTGVQTCALPICPTERCGYRGRTRHVPLAARVAAALPDAGEHAQDRARSAGAVVDGGRRRQRDEIGRASCRERV